MALVRLMLLSLLSTICITSMALCFVGMAYVDIASRRLSRQLLRNSVLDAGLREELENAHRRHILSYRRRVNWLMRRREELPPDSLPSARRIVLIEYLNWGLAALMLVSFWAAWLVQEGYV